MSYAREAHQLRLGLFQKKFTYSFVKNAEKYNETGDIYQKFTLNDQNLQVQRSAAHDIWSFDTGSCNLENCYLSPYNVLQCYLESTLQVFLSLLVDPSNLGFMIDPSFIKILFGY